MVPKFENGIGTPRVIASVGTRSICFNEIMLMNLFYISMTFRQKEIMWNFQYL